MQTLRFVPLAIALSIATTPLTAFSQSSDIQLDTTETLDYQLRVAIAPGTEQVYCYQQSRMIVVGSVGVSSGTSTTTTVPVHVPDPVIRCASCNAWGCSALSSNSAVVFARNPLDVDNSGTVDVNDMASCLSKITQEIY